MTIGRVCYGLLGLSLSLLVAGSVGLAIWIGMTPGADQNRLEQYEFFQPLPRRANIAHRGASGRAAEHSLNAYQLALQSGADVLELDLRLLRDGVLVVAHDADLKRMAGLELVLKDLSWAQLEALSRQGHEGLPQRLDSVLTQFEKTSFNLEIKDASVEAAHRLALIVEEANATDRVLVASMHHQVLVEFRKRTSNRVATAASGREALRFYVGYRLGFDAPVPFEALQLPPISWLGLDRSAFIRYVHGREVVVHYWTVDKAAEQRHLLNSGADGIMSNYPGILAASLCGLAGSESGACSGSLPGSGQHP